MHKVGVVVIAFLVWMLSGCETMKSVDRGLYQVTDSVSEQDRVTGRRTLSLQDRTQQIEKGNAAAKESIQQEYGGKPLNEALDPKAYARVVGIFQRVLAVSHMRSETWEVVLVPDDSYNASTFGGTIVVVNQGLMKQAESDDEIAVVLGHELGHVAANHPFETLTQNLMSQAVRSKSAKTEKFQAAFTHENEREADKIGILYAALAGYDPGAASRIWQRMYAARGNSRVRQDGTPYWMNHPVYGERAAETASLAETVMPYYTPGKKNPQFAELLETNALWSHQEASDGLPAGSGGGALAALETATQAYTAHLKAKTEAARQQRRAQLTTYADSHSAVLSHGPLPEGGWGMRFRYQGSISLDYLSVVAVFQKPGTEPFMVASEVRQPIRPGDVLTVVFKGEQLAGVDSSTSSIRYVIDDAGDAYTQQR